MVGLIAPAIGFAMGIYAKREGYDATDLLPPVDILDGDFIVTTEAEIAAQNLVKQREGLKLFVYNDSNGFPTVGYGHKVLPRDNLVLGQRITQEQADEFFQQDFYSAFDAARGQARDIGLYYPTVIAALTSVNYQLGIGWKRIHRRTWKALIDGNYQNAINEIQTSLWHRQTPKRTNDLIAAIRSTVGVA